MNFDTGLWLDTYPDRKLSRGEVFVSSPSGFGDQRHEQTVWHHPDDEHIVRAAYEAAEKNGEMVDRYGRSGYLDGGAHMPAVHGCRVPTKEAWAKFGLRLFRE